MIAFLYCNRLIIFQKFMKFGYIILNRKTQRPFMESINAYKTEENNTDQKTILVFEVLNSTQYQKSAI